VPFTGCEFNGDLRDKADEPYPKINGVHHTSSSSLIYINFNRSMDISATIGDVTATNGSENELSSQWLNSSFGPSSILEITLDGIPASGTTVTVTLSPAFLSIDGDSLVTEDYPNPFQITW